MSRALWIIVCGGRDYDDYNKICSTLWTLEGERGRLFIRHGGANGADSLADRWCYQTGHTCQPVFADWRRYGQAAGPMRNQAMLDMKPPVKLVVAFPGSNGTADMVARAKKAGIEVMEIAG